MNNLDLRKNLDEYLLLCKDVCQVKFENKKNINKKNLDKILSKLPKLMEKFECCIKIVLKKKNVWKYDIRNAIKATIYKNESDYFKKKADKNFYMQNALCFLNVMRKFSNLACKLSIKSDNSIMFFYIYTIQDFIYNSEFLLSDSIEFLLNGTPFIPRRNIQATFEMWQAVRQSLYPRGSGLSFWDKEYDGASIGLLRIAIENKIRYAFGCFYMYKENQGKAPLPLNKVIDAIKCDINKNGKLNIKTIIDFSDIDRIYRWSNIYMHGGFLSYSWNIHSICEYLHPFFVGEGNSTKNGVRLKRGYIYTFWNQIEKENDITLCPKYSEDSLDVELFN